MPESLPLIINITFFVIAFLFALVGMLIGLKRGLFKSLLQFGIVLVALILTVGVCLGTTAIVSATGGIEGIIERASTVFSFDWASISQKLDSVAGDAASTIFSVIEAVASTVIALLVFVPMFIFFLLLGIIPYAIIQRKITAKPAGNKPWGMLVGAVCGFFIFVVLMMPLSGTLSFVGGIVDSLANGIESVQAQNAQESEVAAADNSHLYLYAGNSESFGSDSSSGTDSFSDALNEIIRFRDTYGKAVFNNVAVKLPATLGGNFLVNQFSSINVNGNRTSVAKEANKLAEILGMSMPMFMNAGKGLSEENLYTAYSAFIRIADLEITTQVASQFMSNYFTDYIEEHSDDEFDPCDMNQIKLEIARVLAATTGESLKEDISTLADVLRVLSENGVIEEIAKMLNSTDPSDSVHVENLYGKLMPIFNENERFAAIFKSTTNVFLNKVMKAYSDSLGEDIEDFENNSFVNDFVYIINNTSALIKNPAATQEEIAAANKEVKKEALLTKINQTLKQANVTVEPESIKIQIADLLAEEFKSRNDVTNHELIEFVIEIILSGDVNVEDLKVTGLDFSFDANPETPDDPDIPDNPDPDEDYASL